MTRLAVLLKETKLSLLCGMRFMHRAVQQLVGVAQGNCRLQCNPPLESLSTTKVGTLITTLRNVLHSGTGQNRLASDQVNQIHILRRHLQSGSGPDFLSGIGFQSRSRPDSDT